MIPEPLRGLRGWDATIAPSLVSDRDLEGFFIRLAPSTSGRFSVPSPLSIVPAENNAETITLHMLLLLAAVASCTVSTAYGYCHRQDLPLPTGMSVHVKSGDDFEEVLFEIHLPVDFPADRIPAVQIAADACWVKKQWHNPPKFKTEVVRK